DKYLLNNPGTHDQAMGYVKTIIQTNITKGYDDTATKFIDKYLLNNPGTHDQAMAYVTQIIQTNIKKGYDDSAAKFIERYLMPELGISYYCEIINSNIQKSYDSIANKFIMLVEAKIKSYISLSSLSVDHKNALRKFVEKLSRSMSDKMITILFLAKTKIKDQEFLKELAVIFVQQMQNVDAEKANMVHALFIANA